MKAYELRDGSGTSALAAVERPVPRPGAGEVLVRMRAASLNFRDLLISKSSRTAPLVPLCDGAGEVAEVGAGVSSLKAGDRVAGNYFQDWVSGPLNPAIPAIANAVYDALGVRIDEVPITPDKVLKALKAASTTSGATRPQIAPTQAPSPWPTRLIRWQPEALDGAQGNGDGHIQNASAPSSVNAKGGAS